MPELIEIIDLLDRNDVLSLDDPVQPWPSIDETEEVEISEVDWGQLFPGRVIDRGNEDWDLYGGGDDWSLPEEALDRIRSGRNPGTGERSNGVPGWDVCAWYQPIHFQGFDWGIYIYDHCILDIAAAVYRRLGSPTLSMTLAKALVRAGFAALFLHEQYHHKVESAAIRMLIVQQSDIYLRYMARVYMVADGTDDQLEEGLANADSFYRLDSDPYSSWLGTAVRSALKQHLRDSFRIAPPGYGLAEDIVEYGTFSSDQCELLARLQEGTLNPVRSVPDDFVIATHLTHSLFSVRQDLWSISSRGSSPLLPTKGLSLPQVSTRTVERLLAEKGWVLVKGRGKGSHRMYRVDGARPIVLPDRKDLSPAVLRNTAKALGMKSASDLVAAAGGG
ncbi:putative periplasmic or secreted lipoprotein [Actinobacteria bacterium IMCC26207]|nr:putative periplasmic or secreted lipoprotein [Actinobacteria bacterium IMCC26207]